MALYCAIGETTTRFFKVMSRSLNGANIGARGWFDAAPARR